MFVLVTGASGRVGSSVVEALESRGIAVRRARSSRSGGRIHDDEVLFDFDDPLTWSGALVGITHLFLLRPPAIADVESTLLPFVDQAAPQLQHTVFLSVSAAASVPWLPHRRVEQHLEERGLSHTSLRAGFFAQNLLSAYLPDIVESDRLFVPAGHQPVAWVDTRDLGEAAARCLLDPTLDPEGRPLTGPEAHRFDDVAALLSAHVGRPIRYEPATPSAYALHLSQQGLGCGAVAVQTALHTALRFGVEATPDPTLERLLQRRPRTIVDTIVDHRGAFDPARSAVSPTHEPSGYAAR